MSEAHLFGSMTFREIYERVLVQPLFRPFAEELLRNLNPDSLLDVACGTGMRATLNPGGRAAVACRLSLSDLPAALELNTITCLERCPMPQ
jgi:hypothetical protein